MAGDTRVYRNGQWQRRGRSPLGAEDVGAFVAGVTMPTEFNTGAGILRATPTIVVNGNVTVPTGTVYADRIINGFVTIQGTGILENCIVRGPAVANGYRGGGPFIQCREYTTTPMTPNVRFCTIEPQTPAAGWAGIGYMRYYAYRCHFNNLTDYFAMFNNLWTADGRVDIVIEACYGEQMVQWQPDYADSDPMRGHTHNDTGQWQGNLGGADDVIVRYNNLNAYLNPEIGQPSTLSQYGPRNHVNGLTQSPNIPFPGVTSRCSGTIHKNWLRGGIQTINIGGNTVNPDSVWVVTDNILQRPGTHPQSPTRALVVNQNFTRTVTGNVYEDDGSAVPIGNG